MSIFKCKMCGGTLEINNNETVAVCEYCDSKQTLPRLDNDRRANLYDRANHFRRNNDFDKAMGIYEQILNDDSTDAEAYWSLVLCRYGIEYVEDPVSRKRIPTINRAQFTSVLADEDYKSALQYADTYQKTVYEEEAKAIDEIQKGILEISQKEEPFDVFICYKETDSNGRRTPDSVLANDLYHQLVQEGLKVFFARITLEDKLGSAYEPYIFAALNSAKVMVVLGTKAEYFNAVWVKNEWSRYLGLIKNGANKTLIPAYKDMDPYDLPDEFSHLQAQDMSKLGFMQDLIRGIRKIAAVDNQKEIVTQKIVESNNANIEPLLRRAFMFLEDGEWASADEYCEKVLDIEPENARAYLGKLMAEMRVHAQVELADCDYPFDNRNNYAKVMRFGDDNLKADLQGYIKHINTRNENARLDGIYSKAKNIMSSANTEDAYKEAAQLFETISEYMNSATLAQDCYEKAEIARKDAILADGKSKMHSDAVSDYESAVELSGWEKAYARKRKAAVSDYKSAISLFMSISGWKDADEQIIACKKKLAEIKAKAEAERLERERQAEIDRIEEERIAKKNKRMAIIATAIVCAVAVFLFVLTIVIIPNSKYNDAIALMESGKYIEAITAFEELNGYKDSTSKIEECNIGIYGEEVWNKIQSVNIGDTYEFGDYEQDNNKSNGREDIEWLILSKEGTKILVISNYALDCKPYNTSYTDETWETCSLRKWLNNDFVNSAFSAEEKAMIPTVTVSADKNPEYSTNPGNATQDQVFLLSITEANKYFSSDSARQCEPTDYAVANGARESDSVNCWWWLRSHGGNQNYASYVYNDGDVREHGYFVTDDIIAVRPAMWIDLEGVE